MLSCLIKLRGGQAASRNPYLCQLSTTKFTSGAVLHSAKAPREPCITVPLTDSDPVLVPALETFAPNENYPLHSRAILPPGTSP